MHTGIKSLEAKVEELQAKTAEGAGQSAGADEEQLKALKEGLQKEFKDGVAKAEENFNFRMDQMKVSDLASKCNKNSEELRELTAVCNVNSGNINKVDDKMKQVDDKMKQVEDSVDQQRLQVHRHALCRKLGPRQRQVLGKMAGPRPSGLRRRRRLRFTSRPL